MTKVTDLPQVFKINKYYFYSNILQLARLIVWWSPNADEAGPEDCLVRCTRRNIELHWCQLQIRASIQLRICRQNVASGSEPAIKSNSVQ